MNDDDEGTHIRFGEEPRVEVAVLVDDLSALGEGELHDAAEDGALHVGEALLGVFEQNVRGEPAGVGGHVPVPLRQPETQTRLSDEKMCGVHIRSSCSPVSTCWNDKIKHEILNTNMAACYY